MRSAMPHVAPALSHLSGGAGLSAFVVAACLVVQMFVFGFAHFTDARWEAVQPKPDAAPEVVRTPQQQAAAAWTGDKADLRRTPEGERTPSRWNAVMANFSNAASWVGIVASLFLAFQLACCVVIAGGASVPGVDRIVAGAQWGLLVILVAIPFASIFPSLPTAGAFCGYGALATASDHVHKTGSGEFGLMTSFVVVPFGAMLASIWAVIRLKQGVAAGRIISSPSELDARIEEELARVRSEGVGSNIGPRVVGVVGQPLGALSPSIHDAEVRQAVADLRPRRPL